MRDSRCSKGPYELFSHNLFVSLVLTVENIFKKSPTYWFTLLHIQAEASNSAFSRDPSLTWRSWIFTTDDSTSTLSSEYLSATISDSSLLGSVSFSSLMFQFWPSIDCKRWFEESRREGSLCRNLVVYPLAKKVSKKYDFKIPDEQILRKPFTVVRDADINFYFHLTWDTQA